MCSATTHSKGLLVPKQTLRGSCLCGRVRFEADVDLTEGSLKCNCTRCFKRRWWTLSVKPDFFRSLGDETALISPEEANNPGRNRFCRHCGVTPYVRIDAADWNDGAYVSVNVAALDDLDPSALAAIPVRFLDGLHDNWWSVPAEVRHL